MFSHLPLPTTANKKNITLLFICAVFHFTMLKEKLLFPLYLQSTVLQYSAAQKTYTDIQTLLLCLYPAHRLQSKAKPRPHIPFPPETRRREFQSMATGKQAFRICEGNLGSLKRLTPQSRSRHSIQRAHCEHNTSCAKGGESKLSWWGAEAGSSTQEAAQMFCFLRN